MTDFFKNFILLRAPLLRKFILGALNQMKVLFKSSYLFLARKRIQAVDRDIHSVPKYQRFNLIYYMYARESFETQRRLMSFPATNHHRHVHQLVAPIIKGG